MRLRLLLVTGWIFFGISPAHAEFCQVDLTIFGMD